MRADQVQLSDEAKMAVKAFRDAKPWRGTFDQRREKFETFVTAFSDACGFEVDFEVIGDGETAERNGGYVPELNKVFLAGKLSVVTLLFAFGMVAGLSRSQALVWARDLFKHYFPRSYAGCELVGGCLVKRREAEAIEDGGDEEE